MEDKCIFIEEVGIDVHGDALLRQYKQGHFLGKGGFAKCYEITVLETGDKYAGKIVEKKTLLKSRARKKFQSEIKIHQSLHHPNIVAFHHFFEDNDNAYLLLELCHNGSLLNLIHRRKYLTEAEVQYYMLQIIEGVQYLHQHLVIHRDLKLGNLFISKDMQIKLGDFGLATRLEHKDERKKSLCGTPNYIAPEMLSSKKDHGMEVDIWSIGVIMFTLLVGKPPYEAANVQETYSNICSNTYSFPEERDISLNAKSLIQLILQANPTNRPSLGQIQNHPFFAKNVPKHLPHYCLKVAPILSKGHSSSSSSSSSTTTTSTSSHHRMALRSHDINANNAEALATSKPISSSKNASKLSTTPNPQQPTTPPHKSRLVSSRNEPEPVGRMQYTHILQEIHRHLSQSYSDKENLANAVEEALARNVDSLALSNLSQSMTWIYTFIDYTKKYGLGYLLTDGSAGVDFNDATRIILSPDGIHFQYNSANSEKEAHTLDSYNPALKKKVTLLEHFKKYLLGKLDQNKRMQDYKNELTTTTQSTDQDMLCVLKWMNTGNMIVFVMSNRSVQVDFHDGSRLILANEGKTVTYHTKNQERNAYNVDSRVPADLKRRLRTFEKFLEKFLR